MGDRIRDIKSKIGSLNIIYEGFEVIIRATYNLISIKKMKGKQQINLMKLVQAKSKKEQPTAKQRNG